MATWVTVAFAVGMGTMIGWKRIVITVGEKIDKTHLTYAQGASAEMMARITIGLADGLGLPVSTTHVRTPPEPARWQSTGVDCRCPPFGIAALAWVLYATGRGAALRISLLVFSRIVS